jgi:hypothetical protein
MRYPGAQEALKRPAGNDLSVVNVQRLYQVRGHLAANPFIGRQLG